MAIDIKNEMLKAVVNAVGRPLKYKTPQDLLNRFCEYVEHIDANPWKTASRNQRQKTFNGNDVNERSVGERLIKIPYTKQGWSLFAGIANWDDYKASKAHNKEFSRIIRAIDAFIENNQITGAVIGEFSGNIVARLNNLAEHQVVREERITDTMTQEEIEAEAERLKSLM